jgi:hypothetical protein
MIVARCGEVWEMIVADGGQCVPGQALGGAGPARFISGLRVAALRTRRRDALPQFQGIEVLELRSVRLRSFAAGGLGGGTYVGFIIGVASLGRAGL